MAKPTQTELTYKELSFINDYFSLGRDPELVSRKTGLTKQTVYNYLSKRNIATEITRRQGEIHEYFKQQNENGLISFEEKVKKLTDIANFNMQIEPTDTGVKMIDAKVAVAALNSLAKIQGHTIKLPKQVEVKVVDTRSELEIRDSIAKLTHEYNELVAIEGETISG